MLVVYFGQISGWVFPCFLGGLSVVYLLCPSFQLWLKVFLCFVFVCFVSGMFKEPPTAAMQLVTSKGQRLCPGYDANAFKCGRFMSNASVDPHTLCVVCRRRKWGRDCSPSTTCWQCEEWPEEQWEVFKAKGKYSDRKRSKSSPNPSPVSSEPRRSKSKTPRPSKSPSVSSAPSRS